ncbi:KGG domain-containing protein [Rugamonas sp. A1-17]|nr:KGG domain-containing protein [Rugamonas sp. A1-17]
MATSNQDHDQGSKQGDKSGSQQKDTSKRGFASMDPEQQREIAAEGGRAAHEKGTAHEFTSEEARRAGSMSHKNDARSSQSSTPASSKGGKEDDEENGKGSRGGSSRSGSSGSSGSKS